MDSKSRAVLPKSNVMEICMKPSYRGWGIISVEDCCAAELSIDIYLVNTSEEGFLKVVTTLEKLGRYKI